MKTLLFLAALALVAREAAAQTLAGTMATTGITSTLQGIGGMNYGAIRGQARGVSNANNNYQSTLNGLMVDPNQQTSGTRPPPPPPPQGTGGNNGNNNNTGGATGTGNPGGGGVSTIQTRRGASAGAWATSGSHLSANPRNIMSTLGSTRGTNNMATRISLRSPTRISTLSSSISTRGGTQQLGGTQQINQPAPAGGLRPPPPPIDPNAAGGGN
jgi:hypothetical protein